MTTARVTTAGFRLGISYFAKKELSENVPPTFSPYPRKKMTPCAALANKTENCSKKSKATLHGQGMLYSIPSVDRVEKRHNNIIL